MKHKWTDEERSLVRRDYNGTNASARIIASKLSVSVYGVKGQVQRLGLAINKKKTWSPREKEKLVEWFPCYSPSTIARRLKRSVNSVVVKSKKMGLHRKDRNGWYTQRETADILGVDQHKVQSWMDNGVLAASRHNGKSPGCMWHIKEDDLRNFIIRYTLELQGRRIDIIQVVAILVKNRKLWS